MQQPRQTLRRPPQWPTLNPGELRHQITFLQPEASQDESGSATRMVPVRTERAKIQVIRGAEAIRNGQITTQTMLIVSLWHIPGITSNMHIRVQDSEYIITEVENELEMSIVMHLNCIALGGNL